MKPIPDDVLDTLKECHVILKGPTYTPQEGDGYPNIESANVGMRKYFRFICQYLPLQSAKIRD